MAITKNAPNTIWLGPGTRMITIVNDIAAAETLTPGQLIERGSSGFIKHNDSGGYSRTFCLNMPELNKGIDDTYASGDLVMAGVGTAGDTFYAWLASGQNVALGADLQSDGAGLLTATTAIAKTIAKSLEAKNASSANARIRVELV
jgi:hypothetical protein